MKREIEWTLMGILGILCLVVLLVIVIVPVLFIYDDYPSSAWWDVAAVVPCGFLMIFSIGIGAFNYDNNGRGKRSMVGLFFLLSSLTIACSGAGIMVTQQKLDDMQFHDLIKNQIVNPASGYQRLDYSFTNVSGNDLLVTITGKAMATTCETARLHYTWKVYQDDKLMYSRDVRVNESSSSCNSEDAGDNIALKIWYIWDFTPAKEYHISVELADMQSFHTNYHESISITIQATTNFSEFYIRSNNLFFHFSFPLKICVISTCIALAIIIAIEAKQHNLRVRHQDGDGWLAERKKRVLGTIDRW